MSTCGERYSRIIQEVATIAEQSGRKSDKITVIAISKGYSWENINEVAAAGCHDFGENRINELLEKFPKPHAGIDVHMIGSLQTNKLKKIIENCTLIHSVDSVKIARSISDYSDKFEKTMPILLQVNTSGEVSKHGFTLDELCEAFDQIAKFKNVVVQGLMTMAPLTEDENLIRNCFALLRMLKQKIEKKYDVQLPHLSMGMSHDYRIAVEEGATLLRIGSAIFEKKKS